MASQLIRPPRPVLVPLPVRPQAVRDIRTDEWFGPLEPLRPSAPIGTQPRQFQFLPGQNLIWEPRAEEPISFQDLIYMADNCDLVRIVIEALKDQIVMRPWQIRVVAQPGETQKERTRRSQKDPRVNKWTSFFKWPNPDQIWSDWLRMVLEDLLVLDAPSILLQRNRKGEIGALRVIDGQTITRLIDENGFTPQAPSPAYQQILYGIPAVDLTTDDLIYRPRNQRARKLYGFGPVEQVLLTLNIAVRRQRFQLAYYCYSDDVEVYTRRGWLKFTETTPDDDFATRQIGTGIFEWQKAAEHFCKWYDGPMVEFSGDSLDLLVTPNHRMLVNSLPRSLGRGKPLVKGEHVVAAEDLFRHATSNTKIPQTSVWHGQEIGDVILPKSRQNAKEIHMTGDQYCAFMGMWLAEGSTKKNQHGELTLIQIHQPKDKRGSHRLFKNLLTQILGETPYFSGVAFEFSRADLAAYLSQFGHAHEKFIPDDIREATPRQLEIFWRYYYAGDGRAIGDGGDGTQQVFTVSRRLADHLSEILQKMGRAHTTWIRPAGTAKVQERTVNAREGYLVTTRRAKFAGKWKSGIVDYHGNVCCVVVPNKFLYVRRNGKAAWCGNTDGNVPEALYTMPPSVTEDRIREFQQWFDTQMAGNLAHRRRIWFIPGDDKGVNRLHFTKEALLKDAADEWFARIICFAFRISPKELIRVMNRACYSADTETLTENGWKTYDAIASGERIAQFDPVTETIEFVVPDALYVYPYEGEMVHFKTANVDMLVTPDHKMWGAARSKLRGGRYTKMTAAAVRELERIHFQASIHPANRAQTQHVFQIPIPLSAGGPPSKEIGPVPMEVWLEFLGYYLSEGGLSHAPSHYLLTLSQRNPETSERIENCLAKTGLSYKKYPAQSDGIHRWNVYGKPLCQWLMNRCGGYCFDKRIPREILALPESQLQILFDAMMAGDGSWDTRPNRSNGSYFTTSPRLANDFQELAFRLGYSAAISARSDKRGGARKRNYRVTICRRPEHSVYRRSMSAIPYSGPVYCFSVPTGLFVTRRNGKIALQGNTAEESQDSSEEMGVHVMCDWVADTVNFVIQKKGGDADIEFTFLQKREADILKQAQADKIYVSEGIRTRNEVRDDLGDDPSQDPEADKLGVTTQQGFLPLDLAQQQVQAEVGRAGATPNEKRPATAAAPEPKENRNFKLFKLASGPFAEGDASRFSEKLDRFLGKAGEAAAEVVEGSLHKADDDEDEPLPDDLSIDDLLDDIEAAIPWDDLVDAAEDSLLASTASGASLAIGQSQVADIRLIANASDAAREYARQRAAEMVGKRWRNGKLVPNPDAKWRIDRSTRDELRRLIEEAFEKQVHRRELAKQIRSAGAFSKARADLIAKTEIVRAQSMGQIAVWKSLGSVKKVRWLAAGPNPCPACLANAAAGEVELGQPFPSGDAAPGVHPNCECALMPVL